MKLTRIILRNFRGHVSTSVTIPDGITLVVGANGSGKTSLFEGVLWSLFGAYEVRTNMDGVRYWHADDGEPCSAEVWLRSGDKEWQVKRTLSGAHVHLNGNEVANGQSGVTEYIEELLGMDRTEFRETYFTEQKALEVLKGKGPTDKSRFYNRVMRFDSVKTAEGLARADKNQLEREVDVLRARMDALPDVDERDVLEATENHATARDRIGIAELLVENGKHYIEKAKRERDKLTDERKAVESLREKLSEAAQDAARARERLSAGEEALREAEEAQAALRRLEGRIEEVKPDAEALEERITELKEEAAAGTGEIRALENRHAKVLEQAETVEHIGRKGECWTCGRDFDAHSYDDAMGHLSREAEEIETKIESLHKRQNEAKTELSKLEADEDNPIARVNQLQAEAEGLKAVASKVDPIKERLDQRKRERDEAQTRHDRIMSAINDVGFDEETWSRANQKVERASDDLSNAKVRLSEAKANEEAARKHREDTKEAFEKRTEAREGLDASSGRLALLGDVDRFLGNLRGYLNDRLRPELSELASDSLTAMTGGVFTALELDEDFNMRLYMGGQQVDGESGGEEDVAAIAMRLATSQLVSDRRGEGFGTLKLDEVFAHVDNEERIPLVMQELRKLVGTGRFEQIILIEHRQEVEEYADHIIRVTRDNRTQRSHVNMIYGDEGEGHNLDIPEGFEAAAD